jgi:hypothetical protein
MDRDIDIGIDIMDSYRHIILVYRGSTDCETISKLIVLAYNIRKSFDA